MPQHPQQQNFGAMLLAAAQAIIQQNRQREQLDLQRQAFEGRRKEQELETDAKKKRLEIDEQRLESEKVRAQTAKERLQFEKSRFLAKTLSPSEQARLGKQTFGGRQDRVNFYSSIRIFSQADERLQKFQGRTIDDLQATIRQKRNLLKTQTADFRASSQNAARATQAEIADLESAVIHYNSQIKTGPTQEDAMNADREAALIMAPDSSPAEQEALANSLNERSVMLDQTEREIFPTLPSGKIRTMLEVPEPDVEAIGNFARGFLFPDGQQASLERFLILNRYLEQIMEPDKVDRFVDELGSFYGIQQPPLKK